MHAPSGDDEEGVDPQRVHNTERLYPDKPSVQAVKVVWLATASRVGVRYYHDEE